MSDSIGVQYATLEGLAGELSALAVELATEAELCRSAALTLGTAVDGETAAAGQQLGNAWAGLVAAIGQGTEAVAATVRASVQSYRRLEAELSDRHLYLQAGVSAP